MNNKNKRQKNLISCGKKKKTFKLYDKMHIVWCTTMITIFVLASKREEFYWGKKKNKNQRVKEINNTY